MRWSLPYVEVSQVACGDITFIEYSIEHAPHACLVFGWHDGRQQVCDTAPLAFFRSVFLSDQDLLSLIEQHDFSPRLAAAAFVALRHRHLQRHCQAAVTKKATVRRTA